VTIYLHSFSRCCLPNVRIRAKFQEKFELIAVLGHPRSSTLVSIESPCTKSLIVILDVSPTVFKILTFKARKWLVFPTRTCLTPYSAWTPFDINITYTSLKSHLMGYSSVADNTGLSSFVWLLLPPKHEKCCDIPREFNLTAVQGHRRSSILVSMESPYVTSC